MSDFYDLMMRLDRRCLGREAAGNEIMELFARDSRHCVPHRRELQEDFFLCRHSQGPGVCSAAREETTAHRFLYTLLPNDSSTSPSSYAPAGPEWIGPIRGMDACGKNIRLTLIATNGMQMQS